MLDRVVVAEKIRNKVLDMTFATVIESCFIEALPFDKEEMRPQVTELMQYTDSVLESLVVGGKKTASKFDILANAIESETDPVKLSMLSQMASICMEAANSVSKRMTANTDMQNYSLDQILESVGLDKAERETFNKNVSDLNIDKIAKYIQDKVIQVIKTERKDKEEADEMEAKLQAAIAPEDTTSDEEPAAEASEDPKAEDELGDLESDELGDLEDPDMTAGDAELDADGIDNLSDGELGIDGEDDELDEKGMPKEDKPKKKTKKKAVDVDTNGDKTGDVNITISVDKSTNVAAKESFTNAALEAFYKMNLSPMNVRKPVTIFSKIAEAAVEAIVKFQDDEKAIPMDAVAEATFNSGITFLDSTKYASMSMETMKKMRTATESQNVTDLGDKTMIVTIIIYTVLETLKTLNLFSPKADDVATMLRTMGRKDSKFDGLSIARESIDTTILALKEQLKNASTFTAVSEVETALESLVVDMNCLNKQGYEYTKEEITSLQGALDSLLRDTKLKKKAVLKDDSPIVAGESKRIATETELGVNKILTLYGKSPLVSMIDMEIDSTKSTGSSKVKMRNAAGSVVCESFVYYDSKNLESSAVVRAISDGIMSAGGDKRCGKLLRLIDNGNNGAITKFMV